MINNKVLLLSTIFYVTVLCTVAQNLVPNPSFEDYTECPNTIGLVSNAYPWTIWRESPEYFNACSPGMTLGESVIDVPVNGFGFQYASEGDGFMGGVFYGSGKSPFDLREMLGCPLLSPLEIGVTYYVSFKVSPAIDGFYYDVGLACNNLGILFTTQDYWWEENPVPIGNFAHIYTSEVISDTASWTTISGSFIADQAYTYLGIGNFFDDQETDTIQMNNFGNAYYFIDEVCVSKNDECGINRVREFTNESFSIFPNPANDFIRVKLNFSGTHICIWNIMGAKVLESPIFKTDFEIDLGSYDSGVYLIEILCGDILVSRQKFIVNSSNH